jgi:hypothetical protein
MREADPSLESRIIININTYEKLVNLLKIFDSNSVHQE